jgi:hypothetical protein
MNTLYWFKTIYVDPDLFNQLNTTKHLEFYVN